MTNALALLAIVGLAFIIRAIMSGAMWFASIVLEMAVDKQVTM